VTSAPAAAEDAQAQAVDAEMQDVNGGDGAAHVNGDAEAGGDAPQQNGAAEGGPDPEANPLQAGQDNYGVDQYLPFTGVCVCPALLLHCCYLLNQSITASSLGATQGLVLLLRVPSGSPMRVRYLNCTIHIHGPWFAVLAGEQSLADASTSEAGSSEGALSEEDLSYLIR
jgi:hypothetical protein